MIRLPFVSRAVYERECQRADRAAVQYAELVQQLVRLKRKGYELAAPAKVRAPDDPEQNAQHRAEQAFLAKRRHQATAYLETATRELMAKGHSQADARAEAERMLEHVRGEAPDT